MISRSGGRSSSRATSSSSGRTRLASTVGAYGAGSRRRFTRCTSTAAPLRSAFSFDASSDAGSTSTASTGA